MLATGAPRDVLGRNPPLDARLGGLRARTRASPARARAEHAPLLAIEGLSAGYGDRDVLRDLSLAIGKGEVVAWIGRNGAGKSTLARTIMGLVEARAGTMRVAQTEHHRHCPVHERARLVGLVFQDPRRQLFSRTVLEEAIVRSAHARRLAHGGARAGEGSAAVVGLDGARGRASRAISRRSCSDGWRSPRRSPRDRDF